jgi:hypothetical protein
MFLCAMEVDKPFIDETLGQVGPRETASCLKLVPHHELRAFAGF